MKEMQMSSAEAQPKSRLRTLSNYAGIFVFVGIHFMALFAVQTGIEWQWVVLGIASYYLRMFAVTAGYHRYFAHRSYRTSRLSQFLIAFLAMTSAQKGILWWAARHRHHHRYSDQVEDVHSPVQKGFWFSHLGWIFSKNTQETDLRIVKDLSKYPEIVWLDRFYLIPPIVYAALLYALGGGPGFNLGILRLHGHPLSLHILYQLSDTYGGQSSLQIS